MNCTDLVKLDPKATAALSCAANAAGDKGKLAACAANAVLPPEAARLASCAATSQGPTSFALCGLAPNMNEELRIAAECAVNSGGAPPAFAACAAGRLTARELTKCFGGQIGKDCFGPNNTIRQHFEGTFRDLTQGLGPNNEITKAYRAVGAAVQTTVQNVGKEGERAVQNFAEAARRHEQEVKAAAEKAAREMADAARVAAEKAARETAEATATA